MIETRERVLERRIEVTLLEVLGGVDSPDFTDRLSDRGNRWRRWQRFLVAAAVLLGIGISVAVATGDGGSRGIRVAPAQDPAPPEWRVVRTETDLAALAAAERAILLVEPDAATLAGLERFRGLERVLIRGSQARGYTLPETAFPILAARSRLRHLTLRLTGPLRREAIEQLARLPILQELTVDSVFLDDGWLGALESLPALSRLSVTGTGTISDVGLAAIAELEGLSELRLRGVFGGSAAGYRGLGRLRGLRVLDLGAPPHLWGAEGVSLDGFGQGLTGPPEALGFVDDSVLHALRDLPNLRSLTLHNRRAITTAGLQDLPPTLVELRLDHCIGVGPKWPAHLRNLEVVGLKAVVRATDAMVEQLVALPRLRQLDLSQCPELTAACAPTLARAKGLTFLSLNSHAWLDDAALDRLLTLTSLHHLDVGSFEQVYRILEERRPAAGGVTAISGAGVRKLAALKQLRHLDVSASAGLDAADLRALQHLPLTDLRVGALAIAFDETTPDVAALAALWPGVDEIVHWPPRMKK